MSKQLQKSSAVVFKTLKDFPESVVSQGSMLWNHTGSWRYLRPFYENKTPPCNQGCPAGNDVEGFIALLGEGRRDEAWRLLMEENPFPAVCGRICFHPCETVCNREQFDRSIAINALERFAGDAAPKDILPEKLREDSGKGVHIIGAGPAGLTAAYFLARLGHRVVIYEARMRPGGVLRYGIPEYRLPKDVLDREIEGIVSLGVRIECGRRVGEGISYEEVSDCDALLIAAGAYSPYTLGLEGEDAAGIFHGIDFLGDVAEGRKPDLGGKVAVIGDGNTAIDAARSALRLGNEVTLYSILPRREMAAFAVEVQEALKEGVSMEFSVGVRRLLMESGRVKGLVRGPMALPVKGEPGLPKPIPGEETSVPITSLIVAIGQRADLGFLPPDFPREAGSLDTDPHGAVNGDGVFAGGDCASNRNTVAHAIGDGKRAAISIDLYLSGKAPGERGGSVLIGASGGLSFSRYAAAGAAHGNNTKADKVVDFSEINCNYFQPAPRSKRAQLAYAERLGNFQEFVLGLSPEAVSKEASRCFHCGVCTFCDTCYIFCPDVAIKQTNPGYEINLDYCKGCGICVHECPRNAMTMVEE